MCQAWAKLWWDDCAWSLPSRTFQEIQGPETGHCNGTRKEQRWGDVQGPEEVLGDGRLFLPIGCTAFGFSSTIGTECSVCPLVKILSELHSAKTSAWHVVSSITWPLHFIISQSNPLCHTQLYPDWPRHFLLHIPMIWSKNHGCNPSTTYCLCHSTKHFFMLFRGILTTHCGRYHLPHLVYEEIKIQRG